MEETLVLLLCGGFFPPIVKFKSVSPGFNLKVLREVDGRNHHPATSWSGGLLTTVQQPTQSRSEKQMGIKITILFSSPYDLEEQFLLWVMCTSFEWM